MQALSRIVGAALVGVTLIALVACSDDSGGNGATTTSSSEATTSTTSSSGATSTTKAGGAGTAAGCPATGSGGVPAGTASRVFSDLDGDGKPDTLYVGVETGGVRRFGIVTASGSRSEWTVPNASPVDPTIYGVVDANQDGQQEVLVNPGRIVYVLTLHDCKLQPYTNKDGDPYAFSVGFGEIGTGVGCIDADGDGKRDLVGLDEKTYADGTIGWKRTIVTLQGTQARNGASSNGTYHSPADDAKIQLLDSVTCGDDTFQNPLVANPG